jgi:ABC-type multidrug transport system fused ATPase/permease subunit
VLRLPMSWFDREENQPDRVTSKITTSCKTVYSFVKLEISCILITFLSLMVAIIGSIALEWRTGLAALALIPFMALLQIAQLSYTFGFSEGTGKIYEESAQIVKEKLINIRTTLSLGSLHVVYQGYENKLS